MYCSMTAVDIYEGKMERVVPLDSSFGMTLSEFYSRLGDVAFEFPMVHVVPGTRAFQSSNENNIKEHSFHLICSTQPGLCTAMLLYTSDTPHEGYDDDDIMSC